MAVQTKPEQALDNTFKQFDNEGRGASIGMMAALVEAGIEPTDFDHIIFASSGSFAGM